MSRRDASDEDEYRESEDEDYNPEVDAKAPRGGSDSDDAADEQDAKADATYAELQGRGGLVKTRAQRRAEAEAASRAGAPKKETAVVGTSGVDVDALWNEMNSNPPTARAARPAPPKADSPAADANGSSSAGASSPSASSASSASNATSASAAADERVGPQEEYITITRTFKFAGDVKTETKRVLKSSAEGQDYLRDQKLKSQGRGPVKRKMSLMEEYQMNKTKKINTLEKSRLDWLGFVDKEGIREDLTKHNKGGYLDKQEFLSRADQKAEQELRQARIKRMQQQQP